ncbi:MAG: hypothetical protein V4850_13715 [Myxococcota bacterium]
MDALIETILRGWEGFLGRPTGPLSEALKDLRVPLCLATALDVVYQIMVHRGVYVVELAFTVAVLALVPYVLLRGPTNRVARALGRQGLVIRGLARRQGVSEQEGTIEADALHPCTAKVGRVDGGVGEVCVPQVSLGEVAGLHVGVPEEGAAEAGAVEVRDDEGA